MSSARQPDNPSLRAPGRCSNIPHSKSPLLLLGLFKEHLHTPIERLRSVQPQSSSAEIINGLGSIHTVSLLSITLSADNLTQ